MYGLARSNAEDGVARDSKGQKYVRSLFNQETPLPTGGNKLRSQNVLPVLVSIAIIILVAILQNHSRLVAAITATMPLSAPLALWIVYTSSGGDQTTVAQFSQGLLIGLIPTIGFMLVAWLAARAGLKLMPVLLLGYGVWGMVLAIIVLMRKIAGA